MAVKDNLSKRGIKSDLVCNRCGVDGESINHALFECPPALQTWALSNIPSPVNVFPGQSVWSNIDYLFWRVPNNIESKYFPWLLWFIWKSRNEKTFTGLDSDPRDILVHAQEEAETWFKATVKGVECLNTEVGGSCFYWKDVVHPATLDKSFTGYRCYVDASWKESDQNTGVGWYCYPDAVDGACMGARRIRRSLSALHAEVEALLWTMTSLVSLNISDVGMATDCSAVVQMMESPEEWPAFSIYVEDFERLRRLFSVFTLHLIPRELNHKADFLARSVRGLSSDSAFVNDFPQEWIDYLN